MSITTGSIDDKEVPETLRNIASKWAHNRELYPGWLVMPAQNRRVLWSNTSEWAEFIVDHVGRLGVTEQIWVLDEYVWRVRRSLWPLRFDLVDTIEETLGCVDTAIDREIESTTCSVDWGSLDLQDQRRWVRLGLAVMHAHRVNGEYGRFRDLRNEVENRVGLFKALESRWYYEQALYHLGRGEIDKTTSVVEEWAVPDSLPFWKIRRAGIQSELLRSEKALKTIQEQLARIRQSTSLSKGRYESVSKEGFAMFVMQFIERSLGRSWSRNDDRWIQLATYRADVRSQIDSLNEEIQKTSPGFLKSDFVYESPLTGRRSGSFSYSSDSDYDHLHDAIKSAYDLAMYLEEGGIPTLYKNEGRSEITARLGGVGKVAEWLRGRYPWYAISLLVRMRQASKAADVLEYHLDVDPSEQGKLDEWVDICINQTQQFRTGRGIQEDWSNDRYDLFLKLLTSMGPFLSEEKRAQALEEALRIYNDEHRVPRTARNGRTLSELFRSLLKWCTGDELRDALPDLLMIPERDNLTRECNPLGNVPGLRFFRALQQATGLAGEDTLRYPKTGRRVRDRAEELIELVGETFSARRTRDKSDQVESYKTEQALWRLLRLREAEVLSEQQTTRLEEVIWEERGIAEWILRHTDFKIYHLLSFASGKASRVRQWVGTLIDEGNGSYREKIYEVINASRPEDRHEQRKTIPSDRQWISWEPDEITSYVNWIEGQVADIEGSSRFGPISMSDYVAELPGPWLQEDNDELPATFIRRVAVPTLRHAALREAGANDSSLTRSRIARLVDVMIQKGLPARAAQATLHRIDAVQIEEIADSIEFGLRHQRYRIQIDAAEAVYRLCLDDTFAENSFGIELRKQLLDTLITHTIQWQEGAVEGVLGWIARCVRDAPDVLMEGHVRGLCILLLVIREQAQPPTEREIISANEEPERRELARWVDKRVQGVKLGIWLMRKLSIDRDGASPFSVDASELSEEIDVKAIVNQLREDPMHPRVQRTWWETAEEAEVTHLFKDEGGYSGHSD